ncbi:hypothetical protein MUY35_01275 [Aliiroseovarius sp. S1339]|uniref:hypothetical protein n=1 Tax=Aliiroseovarius sp. S1339 TaxID=2936990 RepID=UPI0020C15C6C|nr:hypothetical protein [Aliiroseovarius sp. S1339]MCK8462478.1 hypothetical protein [Aliiroseovarius sp. S1339]
MTSNFRNCNCRTFATRAGARQGPDLARQHNIAALLLISEGQALSQIATGTFDAHAANEVTKWN